MGRILRPKQNSTGEFNAFFYTLVSTDTAEMFYSQKRQQCVCGAPLARREARSARARVKCQTRARAPDGNRCRYLIDQGYTFKVVPDLVGRSPPEGSKLGTHQKELELLRDVLCSDNDAEAKEAEKADDDEFAASEHTQLARRTEASMSSLTGAGDVRYLEYEVAGRGGAAASAGAVAARATKARAAGAGGGGGARSANPSQRHALFKARFRQTR